MCESYDIINLYGVSERKRDGGRKTERDYVYKNGNANANANEINPRIIKSL